jgi:hypothetical protein
VHVAVVQVKEVEGEGLGMMFATAGGGVEETVEAEKGCVAWKKEMTCRQEQRGDR